MANEIFKTEHRTIDGHSVDSTVLPALRAVRLKARLAQKVLPAVGKFIGNFKQTGKKTLSFESMDMTGLSSAFEAVAENLSPEDLESLILDALSATYVDGKEAANRDNFNMIFAGKMLFMYKVVAFSLEVNFGDFFGAFRTGFLTTSRPATEQKTPK